jgi:ribonuclease HII
MPSAIALAEPTLNLERALLADGHRRITGVDEAGRGPLAGPVVAAAVQVAPEDWARLATLGVRDSKLLSPQRREALFAELRTLADIGVSVIAAEAVDRLGIAVATYLAMRRAVARLDRAPEFALVDGNRLPDWDQPSRAVVAADRTCLSVAAASVVAKVTRDRIMCELDCLYPGYGFARHKGYGTEGHLERLAALGPSPIHRRSFAPVRLCAALGTPQLAA